MYKRILAAILAAALSFGTLSDVGTVYAKTTPISDAQQTESLAKMEDNLSLRATNSFGNLLVNAIDGEALEQEENEGNNIFSIEMSGTQASVSFETAEEDASLVVGIYDEEGTAMLASGSLEVTKGETSAVVEIETEDMPQYFYIKGFLVDSETLRPLCTMYESPNYTQEMQEFLSKTTEDFDADKVLNLDEDTSNNFAVYDEDTHIIKQSESANEVISADDENQVYVIENADESITSLQQGDIFSYEYGDGSVLLVKVESITMDGTTATITGADTSMEEVFAYVKIDAEASAEDAQVDASSLEEGVVYEGMTEDTGEVPALGAYEGGATYGKSHSFKFVDKKIGSDNNYATLSGGLELNLANTVKFYISTSYQYLELKIDYSAKINLSVSGQGKGEISLALLGFSPVPGVYIEFTPSFVIQVNAKVNAGGQLSGVVGYSVSNNEGIKSLTSTPTFQSELKGELTLYVGLSLEPKIKILSDKIAKASMKATAGAEVKGTMLLYEPASSSKKHDCKQCIDGDIMGKCGLDFGATLLNWDKLDFKYTKNFSVKIFDFYYSFDYNQFAFTECPHLSYRVDVTVADSTGNPVEGAKINGQYGTDKNGAASLWLNDGSHTLSVVKTGYRDVEKKITVQDGAKKINVSLKTISEAEEPVKPEEPEETIEGKKVKAISLGFHYSGAITEDGSLYMWGANPQGQLGNGSTTFSSEPVKILEDVREVSLGNHHSGAITEDGSLYMWGCNGHGELGVGDGSTAYSLEPVKVLEDVKKVSLGGHHSGAITEDGSLYMWGCNDYGELGDGSREDRRSPVKILDHVKDVNLGLHHSGAIMEDGSLYMWGDDRDGQLGDGSVGLRQSPVKILDHVKDVNLGYCHSGAITEDGSLYMWGDNDYGELGDGSTIYSSEPVKILEDVKKVGLGDDYSGAVTEDGSLYMWGWNRYGELGDGTTTFKYRPVKILDCVKDVNLGYQHGGAITEDGSLYMWGYNYAGQLGDGTTENRYSPVKITIASDTSFLSNANAVGASRALGSAISAVGASTEGTASFTDLEAGEVYNFYVMKERDAESPLGSANLCYITQTVSDAFGNLSISYQPTGEGSEVFLVAWGREDIAGAEVTVEDLTYNGQQQYAKAGVTYNGVTLTEGQDYELCNDYSATDVGEYTLRIRGISAYRGSLDVGWNMLCKHEYAGKVTTPATCTSNGIKTYICSICKDSYTEEIAKTAHTYQTTTTKAGTKKNGSIVKKCTVCGSVASKTTIYYPKTITLSRTGYIYNGKVQKPSVTVKDSKGKKLKKGMDYTVSYSGGCKNVGKCTVTIKFKGDYSGTVKKTFTVAPKSTSLSKLTAKKKGFTAKWKKLTSQTTGYEIQYSTNSKFTKKTTKTATVSKNKTTSKSISKLKAKKKYYVRIRTYKTVKVNGKSTKIYSSWSKAKTVTTKK